MSSPAALVRRLAVAVVTLLLAGACGQDAGGPRPLSLTLEFDPGGQGGCLACGSLDNCALDCGGVVGVFLIDASTDAVLDQRCRALPGKAGDTLRDLPGFIDAITLTEGVSVGRSVVVEIAVFSPSPFVSDPSEPDAGSQEPVCKRARKSETDPPSTEDGHQPSFWGRSAPITVRAGDNPLSLSMSCVFDRPACATRPDALVTARVIDMSTQLHPENPQVLDVRFGELQPSGIGFVTFVPRAELLLPDNPPDPPEWSKKVVNAIYDPILCLATQVTQVGMDTGTISCDGTDVPGGPDRDSVVTTVGYTVSREIIDTILPQLGGTPGTIPNDGILIGKVVNAAGGPVDGATVKSLDGDIDVSYLDADLSVLPSATSTSSSGWFVMHTPPRFASGDHCCEFFSATKGSLIGCTRGKVGLVAQRVMAAVIVVDPSAPDSCGSPP